MARTISEQAFGPLGVRREMKRGNCLAGMAILLLASHPEWIALLPRVPRHRTLGISGSGRVGKPADVFFPPARGLSPLLWGHGYLARYLSPLTNSRKSLRGYLSPLFWGLGYLARYPSPLTNSRKYLARYRSPRRGDSGTSRGGSAPKRGGSHTQRGETAVSSPSTAPIRGGNRPSRPSTAQELSVHGAHSSVQGGEGWAESENSSGLTSSPPARGAIAPPPPPRGAPRRRIPPRLGGGRRRSCR